MERNLKMRKSVDWKSHLTWSAITAVAILIVNLYHCTNGVAMDWCGPMLVLLLVFAILTICDWGQSWRISPPFLIMGGLLSMCLWNSAYSSFDLWRQTGSMAGAMLEFFADVGYAFILASMFVAYRYTMSFLLKLQHANRNSNA